MTSEENSREFILNWRGPVRLKDFDGSYGIPDKGGIYLWSEHGKLGDKDCLWVTYVGETANFYDRFIEHFTLLFSGGYGIWDMSPEENYPEFFAEQIQGKMDEEINSIGKAYRPQRASSRPGNYFFNRFVNKKWQIYLEGEKEKAEGLIHRSKFFFATVQKYRSEKDVTATERREIEATINHNIRNYYQSVCPKLKNLTGGNMHMLVGKCSTPPSPPITLKHIDSAGQLPQGLQYITNHA